MTTSERCTEDFCGFEWDAVISSEVGQRVIKSAGEIADLISSNTTANSRQTSDVWSPVEYAGHVRDVLFNIRDRLIVAMNEDNPLCKGLFGTSRINFGLYKNDSPAEVAQEVRVAASLFARTWERIPSDVRERTMVYGWPRVADRSLHWVAAQALHEVEHHLSDIRAGLEG